jgi:hypothetical protein
LSKLGFPPWVAVLGVAALVLIPASNLHSVVVRVLVTASNLHSIVVRVLHKSGVRC